MKVRISAFIVLGLLLAAGAAWAHHNMSAVFDFNDRVTFTGTLTSYDWRNPHIELNVDTKGEGARVFANRIMAALLKSPLSTGVDARSLSLSFGAACVPEDFLELGLLLSAAEAAKANALTTVENPIVLYRDLLAKG